MGNGKKSDAELIFEAMQGTMVYLYGRWQDERAYEDFANYVGVVKNALASSNDAAVFEKMTKRPFAVTFTLGQDKVVIGISGKTYFYKVYKNVNTTNAVEGSLLEVD